MKRLTRRITALVLALALPVGVVPAGAGGASDASVGDAPAPPEIARLIPADAAIVAAVDLRSDNPTIKLMLDQLRPQERAVGEALLLMLAQMGLSEVASGVDVETDVLPWVGRRVYLAGLPTGEKGGPPRLMALVEVRDAGRAAKTLDAVLPKLAASRKGKLFQRQVGGALLRHLSIPGFGHVQLALKQGALAISPVQGLIEDWLKASPAADGDGDWAQAMRLVPPGMLMVAVTNRVAGKEMGVQAGKMGLGAAALSVSASPAGTRVELALKTKPGLAATAVEQLAKTPLTGEALAAVPEAALAAASLAPVGNLLKELGFGALVSTQLRVLLGSQAGTLMARLQPVLDNLLKSETAAALMALTPKPRWLGVVAMPDEAAVGGAVSALHEALATVRGAKVTAADDASGPGFVATLPTAKDKPGVAIHVIGAGKRLLVASDPETLKQGVATAHAPQTAGLRASAAYQGVREQIGTQASLELFVNTRSLGQAAASLGFRQALKDTPLNVPEKYATRFVDALLLPYGGMGLSLAARDGVGRATIFQQVDWKASSGPGAMAIVPVVAAVAVPALLKARKSGKETAALQVLKSLRSAEETYRVKKGRYANLNQLKAESMSPVGEREVDGVSGYRFHSENVGRDKYLLVAEPPTADMTRYRMDETGRILP